jgi:NSS family neurotransmitter:Na+ symporter
LTVAHLGLVILIVAKDVEEGIERWVGYMIPAFGLLLIILAFKALSFETSFEALRFLFYPDFSHLKITSFGQALGHVCFTLSIGLGSMVTFGSYFREKVYVPLVGFRVATLDALISLFAGLLIFPLALAAGSVRSGPELLFQSVPVLFTRIAGGYFYGILFFLCLYLAALGASIGLLECVVANFIDTKKWQRGRAALVAGGACLLMALIPALSSSAFRNFKIGDRGLLELLDAALINWLLPIVALGVSQVISYRLDDQTKRAEFFKDDSPPPLKLYSHWIFVFRWVVPVIIVAALLLQGLGLFIRI